MKCFSYLLLSSALFLTLCASCGGNSSGTEICPNCNGAGHLERMNCITCNGSGTLKDNHTRTVTEACPLCSGRGYSECSYCNGTGRAEVADVPIECMRCHGRARFECDYCHGSGQYTHEVDDSKYYNCPTCNGVGSYDRECDACKGRGRVSK